MMLKQRGRKDLKEGGPGFYRSLAFFKRYGHLMLFLDQVLPFGDLCELLFRIVSFANFCGTCFIAG